MNKIEYLVAYLKQQSKTTEGLCWYNLFPVYRAGVESLYRHVNHKNQVPVNLILVYADELMFIRSVVTCVVRVVVRRCYTHAPRSPPLCQQVPTPFEAVPGIIFRTSSDFPRHQNSTEVSRFEI
jgi:hypothetical protein